MKKLGLLICCLLWSIGINSQSADLSLELTVDDNFVDIGQTVTFTVEVTNNGPSMARGVLVMDKLPAGYRFVSADPGLGTTYNYASGVWTIGSLGNGVSTVLSINAEVITTLNLTNLAEVMKSDLLDHDSVPNNGVDTDGDGNVIDDPDDEDDGDGQMVIVGASNSASKDPNPATGECLAPLDVESSFAANPVDEIDAVFKFDYKIEAIMDFQMSDMDGFSPEYTRGNPTQMILEYYVNSADGSILFPGGPTGFFKTNLTYSDRDGTIDAAIWLANGQMVSYVHDAKKNEKHAITRESVQTANSRLGTDYISMMQFFQSAFELAELPDPLPSNVQWPRSTKGYRGELIEGYTGLTNTWDMYFDTAPTPIRTSCIMMGFMVGVLKDVRNTNCNRLAVYTKVNIGGEDSGDVIEVVLKSIKPMGITFDGTIYKPLTIGGDYGTTALTNMDDFEAKMRSIETRKLTYERERKHCISDWCVEEKDALLESLRKEKSHAICQQMVAMGMEDSFAECMRKEGE
jgi:uncharacterized repeat protein (TIGR01451 family)